MIISRFHSLLGCRAADLSHGHFVQMSHFHVSTGQTQQLLPFWPNHTSNTALDQTCCHIQYVFADILPSIHMLVNMTQWWIAAMHAMQSR